MIHRLLIASIVCMIVCVANDSRGQDLTREQLFELELQYEELSSQFGPNHPRTLLIKKQLADCEQKFSELKPEAEDSGVGVQQVAQKLEVQIQRLKLELDELSTKLGNQHPSVRALERRIGILKSELTQQQYLHANAKPTQSVGAESRTRSISDLRRECEECEAKCLAVTKLLQKASSAETKQSMRGNLAEVVKQSFEARLRLQRAQIAAAAEDLALARERLDRRVRDAESIIERRVDQLIKSSDRGESEDRVVEPEEIRWELNDENLDALRKLRPLSSVVAKKLAPLELRAAPQRDPYGMLRFESSPGVAELEVWDRDGNGRLDEWRFFHQGRISCIDHDIDGDGVADVGTIVLVSADATDPKQDADAKINRVMIQAHEELAKSVKVSEEKYAKLRAKLPLLDQVTVANADAETKAMMLECQQLEAEIKRYRETQIAIQEQLANRVLNPDDSRNGLEKASTQFVVRLDRCEWKSVFRWLSEINEMPVAATRFPTGSCTLRLTDRYLTRDELMTIFSAMLQRAEATLERKNGQWKLSLDGATGDRD